MDIDKESAAGLTDPMRAFRVDYSIAGFTPTLCALWGLPCPQQCQANAVEPVLQAAREKLGEGRKLQKTLVFCPDAIGDVLWNDFPGEFAPLKNQTDLCLRCTSVMPSVTPVCFATIFSGASPEVHGIQEYCKPVLTVETLFNVFSGAGKNVAVVAVNRCSIDRIFRDRNIDYYSLRSDAKSFDMCRLLLEKGGYDLLVCYDGSYDSSLHKSGCRSEASLAAMRCSIARFCELAGLLDKLWAEYDYLLTFTPDHGGHDQPDGKGCHGMNVYDDMVVNHCYRFRAAQP